MAFNTLSGLYALLGIPIILLIHFLQRKTNRVITSTSFLIKRLPLEEVKGPKLSHLKPSWPLFLQIISIAIITILLLDPHTPQIGMTNRVVLLLDSSVSMRPFKKQTVAALRSQIPNLKHTTLPTEWIVSESGGYNRLVYSGTSDRDLLSSIERWQPSHNHHSLLPAIEHAQRFSQRGGSPIVVTDQQPSEISGYDVIGVGHPIDNVGFSGLTTSADQWSVALKNNSNAPQRRTLTFETSENVRKVQDIEFKPQELKILQDSFSEDNPSSRIILKLQPDEFDLDDTLPILKPRAASLKIFLLLDSSLRAWEAQIIALMQPAQVVSTPTEADFVVMQVSIDEVKAIKSSGIFLLEGEQDRFATYKNLLAENIPLLQDLHFEGIRSNATQNPVIKFEHKPLLYDESRPVAWLRDDHDRHQILFGSEIRNEHALTHQSIVVMLHRFIEKARLSILRYHVAATETNQVVQLPEQHKYRLAHANISGSDVARSTTQTSGTGQSFSTPAIPGFVEVFLDETPYALYNNYFSDPREADFSEATDLTQLNTYKRITRQINSRKVDWTYPLLGLLGLIQLTWYLQGSRNSSKYQFDLGPTKK
jgi:hypothetical protein